EVAEEVGRLPAVVYRELGAGDHLDALPRPRLEALGEPRQGVVVGEGDAAHAPLPRPRHKLRRAHGPVGVGRVHMKIAAILALHSLTSKAAYLDHPNGVMVSDLRVYVLPDLVSNFYA